MKVEDDQESEDSGEEEGEEEGTESDLVCLNTVAQPNPGKVLQGHFKKKKKENKRITVLLLKKCVCLRALSLV